MHPAPISNGPARGKKQVVEGGVGDENERLQSSEADDCLSEWIYLTQTPEKLALQWLRWQTRTGYLRWQTPEIFTFYRTQGKSSDGSEGDREDDSNWDSSVRGKIISEVRLGKKNEKCGGAGELEEMFKQDKTCKDTGKGEDVFGCGNSSVSLDKDFIDKKKKVYGTQGGRKNKCLAYLHF